MSDIRRVAYHEAGHAIMAYIRQVPFAKIVVDLENSAYPGYVEWGDNNQDIRCKNCTREQLYSHLLINLAGKAAESLMLGDVQGDYPSDLRYAHETARELAEIDKKMASRRTYT
jgi:ATP-dependent Zn protease